MFDFFKKTDEQIRLDVISEMKWNPSLSCDEVSVTAKDGIVTLRGTVPHYFEKTTAEESAQRVGGVRAVANELEVKMLQTDERSDQDIAEAALSAIRWNYQVPDGIKVTVTKGWVTLKGEVEWDYERSAAGDVIRPLMGVCGVTNEITIKSKVQPSDIKSRIEDALKRSAESEGRKISVSVDGSRVTLSGNVHSFSESEDARLAAWYAPGVTSVENHLKLAA
jgi:osmotically-inducible protein OsmY